MAEEPIVIRQSRAKAAIGLAIAGAMLAACIWLLFQGEPHSGKGAFARYVGTPVAAVLTLIWLKTFLLPATLRLSSTGLELRQLPGGFNLPWSDVAGAKVENPWFVEKVSITLPGGKKKQLPAAWERPPAHVLQALLEARDRWISGAPSERSAAQAAIVT